MIFFFVNNHESSKYLSTNNDVICLVPEQIIHLGAIGILQYTHSTCVSACARGWGLEIPINESKGTKVWSYGAILCYGFFVALSGVEAATWLINRMPCLCDSKGAPGAISLPLWTYLMRKCGAAAGRANGGVGDKWMNDEGRRPLSYRVARRTTSIIIMTNNH